MKKKVSLYVFYQFNPNKQFANFQIVGIPSSKKHSTSSPNRIVKETCLYTQQYEFSGYIVIV